MTEFTGLTRECPFCSNIMFNGPQCITTVDGVGITLYGLRCPHCGAVAYYAKSSTDQRIDKCKIDFTLEPKEWTIARRMDQK